MFGSFRRPALTALAFTVVAAITAPVKAEEALARALDAAGRGDTATIAQLRPSLDRVDQKLVDWYLIRMGSGLPSAAITRFAIDNPTWPDPEFFRRRAEQALEKENPPADDVIGAFTGSRPYSDKGRILLARALVAKGRRDEAAHWAREAYRNEKLSDDEETILVTEFAGLLTPADHKARLDIMLLKGRGGDAVRVAKRLGGGYLALAQARLAIEKKQGNAAALLAAVPGNLQSDPAYLFGRAQLARRMEHWREAGELLASAPKDPRALVLPDEWWEEKRIVSRKLLDMGDARLAYKVVAGHAGSSSANQAEADFHAGWYALRFLNDPSTGLKHFSAILQDSTKPVSRARAYYWMARAAEAGGGGSAGEYYRQAAAYGFTFYGQMARAKLGIADLGLSRSVGPGGDDRAAIARDDRFVALKKIGALGRKDLAATFYKHMAETLPTAGQVAALVEMAEAQGWTHYAVMSGKAGAQRGLDMAVLAFPLKGMPSNLDTSGLEKALAYAITRQESEFNQEVVSSAGAVGIFQVMPDTGRDAAKYLGISFDAAAWRRNPQYNIRLGAAYVNRLVTNYDGNYVMAIAGYNAGPGRIRDWVQAYGDPRTGQVDVVDWMERIPFSETRNYVQRVLENLQVYRFRLEGRRLEIAQDLRRGVGARAPATTGSIPAAASALND